MSDKPIRAWRPALIVLLIMLVVLGVGFASIVLAWLQAMALGISIDDLDGASRLSELVWPAVFLVGPLTVLLLPLVEIWRWRYLISIPYTWSVSTLLALAALLALVTASTSGTPDPFAVARLLVLSHTILGTVLITEPFARLIARLAAPSPAPRPRGGWALLALALRAALLFLVLIAAWLT